MSQVYVTFFVTEEKNPKQALNVVRDNNKIKYIVDYDNHEIFFDNLTPKYIYDKKEELPIVGDDRTCYWIVEDNELFMYITGIYVSLFDLIKEKEDVVEDTTIVE